MRTYHSIHTSLGEWNCDKGRWAFAYISAKDRITFPMVRGEDGVLREVSWPEALTAAANGLSVNRAAVLVGGRTTIEDAYAYSKFARVALNTNDIDFRARLHSSEERDFLSSIVVGSHTYYSDIDKADHVLLLGFEPEEESPIVFLRIRKQVRKRGLKVTTVAPFASRGSTKIKAELISTGFGDEAVAISKISGLTNRSVILVGERLSESVGALSAAHALAQSSGAKLGWIPRRAGERGALEAGAIGTLLPGGRPVTDAAARVDVQSAWGVSSLPAEIGRSTSEILDGLHTGDIEALLVGGVDPLDISIDAHRGLEKAFVVSLEIRQSAITEIANVVLPVAAVAEKSGTFLDWEGRPRSFEPAITDSLLRSDLRILSMIAEKMGRAIKLPFVATAAEEIASLGNWDGARASFIATSPAGIALKSNSAALSSWRLLLDAGSLQDGEDNLANTAHPSIIRISQKRADSLGVKDGDQVTVSTEVGSITLACEVSEIENNSVWIPRNSHNSRAIPCLGKATGSVSVVKA